MCNAHNRSEGCNCGFGPPYPISASGGSRTSWPEEVADKPWLMERGLRDMAWSEDAVAVFSGPPHAPGEDGDQPRGYSRRSTLTSDVLRKRLVGR